MSSVTYAVECEQCGHDAYKEFQTRTQEETRQCFYCGAVKEWYLKKDENGEYLMENGTYIEDYRELPGYGAYEIVYKDGCGKTGVFNSPISDEDFKRMKEMFSNGDVDLEKSYFSVWDVDKKELKIIYGVLPEYHWC